MLTLYKRHTHECAEARKKAGAAESVAEICALIGISPLQLPHSRGGHPPCRWIHSQDNRPGEVAEGRRAEEEWEDAGTLNVQPPAGPAPQAPPSVEHVIDQFHRDRKACGLSPGTLKKYRQFTDLLNEFCVGRGVVYITQFGTDYARAFRESWTGASITNLKRLERMKAFFAWVRAQGCDRNQSS